MRSTSGVPSCVLALGRCVVLAVGLGFLACRPSEQVAPAPRVSTEVSAPRVSAPFDVMSVVRRAERAFRAKGDGLHQ
ncbi:hypothetical protein [Myxococcus stipitatus]|uniref:hypothetical protein n=1 Tax=Myxococcus stipitatus TaxID=83455 RepID=UPI0030D537D9